ncbi:hypothetical protein ACWFR1_07760 [Streptomyces sp. NPDC055103]
MPDDRLTSALEKSLRAPLSGSREAEEEALVAFRAARDAGLHTSRAPRERDDWTPADRRRLPRRSLKAAVAALVASVTLGGVAVATGSLPERFLEPSPPAPEPVPSSSAPGPEPVLPPVPPPVGTGRPGSSAEGTPVGPVLPDRLVPRPPVETGEAPCRPWGPSEEKAGEKALEKLEKLRKAEERAGGKSEKESGDKAGQESGAKAGPVFCREVPPPGSDAVPGSASGLSTGSSGPGQGVGGGS